MSRKFQSLITLFFLAVALPASAQVGQYRNEFAVGINGGYVLNSMSFMPKVPQSMHSGMTAGVTFRYTSEKYFNMICGVQLEANYSQLGWKEDILSVQDEPCIKNGTDERMAYQRTINYFQVPLLASLGFGREYSGAKFFLVLGPQFGYMLSESTKANFSYDEAFNCTPSRVSATTAQDSMAVENKLDYGITAGAGVEVSLKRAGHILLEARYYYGLGNIYGDSKADYFARSNHGSIIFKMSYLFDIVRTRKKN